MTQLFLGIESSCDDTGAAVVSDAGQILSNVVVGQDDMHAAFGGVVPEIAARAHTEKLDVAVETALARAGVSLSDISAIAVTAGPGLIGGVVSGVTFARGLAAGRALPLMGINHLAGHALTPRLVDPSIAFPFLLLLVSGGHCQLLVVQAPNRFHRLGTTIDDAPGEAFDKTARLLGLPQPGGPAVEQSARDGDVLRFRFPRPLLDRPGCDMSFSGLKTALRRERDKIVTDKSGLTKTDRSDLCAGFQAAVTDVLVEKTRRALEMTAQDHGASTALAVAGGVAANRQIRAGLEDLAKSGACRFVAPPLSLCTDNAAMIAWAGIEQAAIGDKGPQPIIAKPRWPLDTQTPSVLGSGKKGAKV
jgi:N6-L-threonylcarbamoyladenine synthase